MKSLILVKLFSFVLLGIGVFILVQVSLPFLAYQVWEIQSLDKSSLLVSPTQSLVEEIEGVSVREIGDFPAFISTKTDLDMAPYKEFFLTIPSLKIKDLKVSVSSNDFDQNPAQLPGTALPGERGNVFITGHSSLPQVTKANNPKLPFFNLPSIKKHSEIKILAGGQEFNYVVEGLKIVDPKEVSVINPPDQLGRYLTLMTCVPPGFNSKRLVVLAKLK